MQKFFIINSLFKNKINSETEFNLLLILNKFECIRSHSDFRLTFINIISRILLEFLILFTFEKSNYNKLFDELCLINFQNFEDILGSYSYCTICYNLKLTQIVKKFKYFKKIMTKERYALKKFLFIETKSIIYLSFYDKSDIIFNNGLRSLLQKFLFLIYKL